MECVNACIHKIVHVSLYARECMHVNVQLYMYIKQAQRVGGTSLHTVVKLTAIKG